MAYATVENVQAATGRLLDDLTANPTQLELEGFLARVSADLDAYLAGAGYDVPTTNPGALAALEGPTTDGATVLALEARYPNQDPPQALIGARARWAAALAMFGKGTHAAQVALQEQTSGLRAGSFAADEAADYVPAPLEWRRVERPFNPNVDPELYEGMPL